MLKCQCSKENLRSVCLKSIFKTACVLRTRFLLSPSLSVGYNGSLCVQCSHMVLSADSTSGPSGKDRTRTLCPGPREPRSHPELPRARGMAWGERAVLWLGPLPGFWPPGALLPGLGRGAGPPGGAARPGLSPGPRVTGTRTPLPAKASWRNF